MGVDQHDEAFLAATLMSVGDAVIATDADGRVTVLNAVAEALTGWTAPDALGRPLAEVFRIVHELTRATVENPVTKALREGRVVGLANHTLLLRPDGSEIAIDDSAAPIRAADGVITGVVLVFRDVTERRQEEVRRQFIAEAIATLGSSLDYRTTVANVARAAVPRVVDWCAVDVLGPTGTLERLAVAHVDPARVALAEEMHRRYPPDLGAGPLAEALRAGRSTLGEVTDELLVAGARDAEHLRITRALGLRSFIVVPLRIGGQVIGVITLVNTMGSRLLDAHDLQLAEGLSHAAAVAIANARLYAAERAARAQAEAALRQREDLLAIVSHDLRSPLSSVAMSAALLDQLEDPVDLARLRKCSAIIGRSAERMRRLIDDLLDLAGLERGQLRIEAQPLDAGTVLEESVQVFAPLAAQRLVNLTVARPAQCVPIVADRARIAQVISNLLGNALKATPPGGRIELSLAHEAAFVRFAVADTGSGIPGEQLPRIFDRYWQGASRTRGGVGLGLSIAKGLVEAHGGQITVRSQVGEGTTVEFTVPASAAG